MRLPAFRYDWRWRLDASPDELWPYVADTNRFNRDAGLPPVEQLAEGANATRTLRFSRFGVVVEWEEQPFEWVRPRRFGVVRRYSRGPIAEMRVRVLLDPDGDGGTDLRYVTAIRPRNLFGFAATAGQVGVLSRRVFERVFRRYAVLARASAQALPDPDRAALAPGARQRLSRAREDLLRGGQDAALVQMLLDLLTRGDALMLARMRPYAIADVWAASRKQTLALFMAATRLGLLDLSWDLLCPLCRGVKDATRSLDSLRRSVHCDTCNIDFAAEFDQAVELSFQPNPAIRQVVAPPFCVAGPQVTPHIAVQQLLRAGETRRLAARLEHGRHRVRALDHPGACHVLVEAGSSRSLELRVADGAWSPGQAVSAPEAVILVSNQSGQAQLVIVERTAWADDAATAAEVTSLQVFRDLFSSEVLAAGDFRSVGRLAVLFTDLRDSTQLYQRIGDAPAYGRVQQHFELMRDIVAAHDGAVVKTIGDSVMAVFRRPVRALEVLVEAQRQIALDDTPGIPLVLKAGLHYGPCIAVELDGRLDYFGSTVNIASRLDKLSRGGDAVISQALYEDPEVAAWIAGQHIGVERFRESLRGLEDLDFDLWRVRMSEPV